MKFGPCVLAYLICTSVVSADSYATLSEQFERATFAVSGTVVSSAPATGGTSVFLRFGAGWGAAPHGESQRTFFVASEVHSGAIQTGDNLVLFSQSDVAEDPLMVDQLVSVAEVMPHARELPSITKDYSLIDNLHYYGFYLDSSGHYRYVYGLGALRFFSGHDWVYHYEIGWMLPFRQPTALGSEWNWHEDLGWVWIKHDHFPNVYLASVGWSYIYGGSDEIWYYSYAEGAWKRGS